MSLKPLLIIGSQSQIGRAAMNFFSGKGHLCVGTDRSTLDLANVPPTWGVPAGVQVAVFCAAITNIHECEKDPARSQRVNVDGTIAVLKKLEAAGVRTIFLSTNLVFSGEKPGPDENTPLKPQTLYGRQKAEVETWMRANLTNYAILRIAKVLVGTKTLIHDWKNELLAGREITPFADLTFCPITVTSVLEGLEVLANSRESGAFHISGDQEITYEHAAQTLCRMMGLSLSLVHGLPARQLGYEGILPKYSTLQMTRLPQLELPQPSSQTGLESYIREILR